MLNEFFNIKPWPIHKINYAHLTFYLFVYLFIIIIGVLIENIIVNKKIAILLK